MPKADAIRGCAGIFICTDDMEESARDAMHELRQTETVSTFMKAHIHVCFAPLVYFRLVTIVCELPWLHCLM